MRSSLLQCWFFLHLQHTTWLQIKLATLKPWMGRQRLRLLFMSASTKSVCRASSLWWNNISGLVTSVAKDQVRSILRIQYHQVASLAATCLWHGRPACYDAVPCRRLSGAERQLKPSISPRYEPPRCWAACPRQVKLPTCTPGGQQRLFLISRSLLSDCHPPALSFSFLFVYFFSLLFPSACCLFSSALLPQACLTSNVRVLYRKSFS